MSSPAPNQPSLIGPLVSALFAAALIGLGIWFAQRAPAPVPPPAPPQVKQPRKPKPPPAEERLPDLIETLKAGPQQTTPERWFRMAAQLQRLGPKAKSAAPLLARHVRDGRVAGPGDADGRDELTAVLVNIGPAAVPAMLDAARDRFRARPESRFPYPFVGAIRRIGPRALPALVASLDDPAMSDEDFDRCLESFGEGVVAPLAGGLKLASPEARWKVAERLGTFGTRAASAVPALRAALADPDAGARARAACALGNIGPKAAGALPDLRAALKDPEPAVRLAAAYALSGPIADEPKQVAPVLLALGAEVERLPPWGSGIAELVGSSAARALGEERARRRAIAWNALLLLSEMGPEAGPAVPLLLRVLKSEDAAAETRYRALMLLGRIRPKGEDVWEELLLPLRNWSGDPGTPAWQALRAVAPEHRERAARFFRERMGDPRPGVRWQAFRALAALDPEAARQSLPDPVRVVVGSDPARPSKSYPPFTRDGVRFGRAPRAPDGVIDAPRTGPSTGAGAGDYTDPFRLPAAPEARLDFAALRKLGPDDGAALPFLLDAWDNQVPDALPAIARLGPAAAPALPRLVRALQQQEPTPVDDVLLGIGDEAIGAVVRAARDEKWPNRWACFRFLARVAPKSKAAVEVLKGGLGDKSRGLRFWIVNHVAALPADAGAAAVPVLALALADEDKGLRSRAAEALAKFGPDAEEAVPLLARQLAADDPETRARACEVLGRVGPGAKDAVPALVARFADGSDEVRQAAIRACGRVGRDAAGPLVEALKSPEARTRTSAARALGQVGPEAKQPALAYLLRQRDFDGDPAARSAAAEAVKRLERE